MLFRTESLFIMRLINIKMHSVGRMQFYYVLEEPLVFKVIIDGLDVNS
jgi:hypothetical protein